MVPSFFPVAILRPFLVVEHHFPRPHQKRGLDGAWGVSFTGSAFFSMYTFHGARCNDSLRLPSAALSTAQLRAAPAHHLPSRMIAIAGGGGGGGSMPPPPWQ